MSKPQAKRKVDDKSALSVANVVRSGTRKLDLVAAMIRGQSAAAALRTLAFCPRRIANDVRKCLQSAIANAENNHALDVDQLVVTEASVGKAFTMKRMHTRGRGRSSRIEKPFSKLRIVVSERTPTEKKAKKTKSTTDAAAKPAAKKTAARKPAAKASKE
ncbi:MAG: 50S ribosomal protein L22 [Bdellovibrionales bacterium]